MRKNVSTLGLIKVNMKWEQNESSQNCQETTCPWHSDFMIITKGGKEQFIPFSSSKLKSVCVSRTLCELQFQSVEIKAKPKKCPCLRGYVGAMLRKMHWDFILVHSPINNPALQSTCHFPKPKSNSLTSLNNARALPLSEVGPMYGCALQN